MYKTSFPLAPISWISTSQDPKNIRKSKNKNWIHSKFKNVKKLSEVRMKLASLLAERCHVTLLLW